MIKTSLFVAAALTLTACATQPAEERQPVGGPETEMATRISRICALPESERDKEIAKLKKESGLVLYCGRKE